MRICMWHGWLLEGTGSNVYTARTAEVLRAAGHDVLLLAQEPHPERFGFIDAWGTVGTGVSDLAHAHDGSAAGGRVVVLRPQIGSLLPVFVYDEYEGFDVKRFVDLSDDELAAYLEANVEALRAAVAWHRSDVVITGHVVPGSMIGLRGVGAGNYVSKIHGSDIEYAVKIDARYQRMLLEGLEGARAVVGSSLDVIERTAAFVPSVRDRMRVAHPGVDVDRFRLRPGPEALRHVAGLLDSDPQTAHGRPRETDEHLARGLSARDADALGRLAATYDQAAPDRDAAATLARFADVSGPIVGYLGKLIPQKGVERMIEAVAIQRDAHGIIVGFGTFREWLEALVDTLDAGDTETYHWLRSATSMQLELDDAQVQTAAGLRARLAFTGRLDHRYAPGVLAGIDVLMVPSTLAEAFGMVAAEGAAAGALPLVARHSGLAEVADALETETGLPGWFSFEPGDGATARAAASLQRLLAVEPSERQPLREALSAFVSREWSWRATARHLLEAAGVENPVVDPPSR